MNFSSIRRLVIGGCVLGAIVFGESLAIFSRLHGACDSQNCEPLCKPLKEWCDNSDPQNTQGWKFCENVVLGWCTIDPPGGTPSNEKTVDLDVHAGCSNECQVMGIDEKSSGPVGGEIEGSTCVKISTTCE